MVPRIAAFVIPLGFDTFAVAVALGLRGLHPLRPAFLFALFETTMPLVGIVVGYYVGRRFEAFAAYVGAIILIGIGLHTLREALESRDPAAMPSLESVRGVMLAGFGISTDEIAIGFPLGALGLPLGPVLLAIGVQAFVATIVGILIGRRLGTARGVRASRIAGILAGGAFLALGCYFVAERILLRARVQ
jgi:putative Mn2+ efflux pump MntP